MSIKFTATNTGQDYTKDFNCIKCGESPFIKLKRENGFLEVTVYTDNWLIGDDVFKSTCPMYLRRNKIEKIKQCMSLMNT